MKKSVLYVGIVYTAIGIAFFVTAILTEFAFEALFWGFGGAGVGSGMMMIYKYLYWSRAGKTEVYHKKIKEERIELHDERNKMLRERSGWITYCIMMGVYCAVLFILSIFECVARGSVGKYVIIGLCALMVFQFVCRIAVVQYLNKKL